MLLELLNIPLRKDTFLRGYCTPNQKLACFVLYFKIIDTFLKNNICILYSQLLKDLKKKALEF